MNGDRVATLCALAAAVSIAACAHPRAPSRAAVAASPRSRPTPKLVALLAESDAFPKLARATTESLLRARVKGLGAAHGSKVSLEVVQLSIECVDPTITCYHAVGRSLAAEGLLFAQITVVKRRQPKITVSLFDVGDRKLKTKAERVFPSEAAATAGLSALVAKATRP